MRKDEFKLIDEVARYRKFKMLKEIKEEMEKIRLKIDISDYEGVPKSLEELSEDFLNVIKVKIRELEAEAEKDV